MVLNSYVAFYLYISSCSEKKTFISVLQIMRWRHRDLPNSVILKIMKSGAELRGNSRSL